MQHDLDRYRQQDLLREAEQHRKLKAVKAAQAAQNVTAFAEKHKPDTGSSLYAAALAELGTRLVEIGESLQTRYGQDGTPPFETA